MESQGDRTCWGLGTRSAWGTGMPSLPSALVSPIWESQAIPAIQAVAGDCGNRALHSAFAAYVCLPLLSCRSSSNIFSGNCRQRSHDELHLAMATLSFRWGASLTPPVAHGGDHIYWRAGVGCDLTPPTGSVDDPGFQLGTLEANQEDPGKGIDRHL